MNQRDLTVNGIRLHVTEEGAGPPLLLLHGLSANAAMMEPEITGLARSFRVTAPDLRGHGRSDRPAAYTLNDHVQDLLGLLGALNLDRVAVLGVSMGSYIAQALTIAAPERVSALVLVVTKASGTTSSTARYLAEHANELQGMTPEQIRLWLGNRMFAPHTPEAVKQTFAAFMAKQERAGMTLDPQQLEAANRAMEGFDFRHGLPRLNVPALVISGRHDILNPPDAGEEVALLIPDARFEVLEDSGHLATLEQTPQFVELVESFLKV
ncbi:alpha/beta fold hydrolase [Deinococcus altitudinis]|uniref:alpha/beta fold hydrolase n=1 Tax=Deinococcus altitudinis TaxID=468914 RepID=UPI0038927F7D